MSIPQNIVVYLDNVMYIEQELFHNSGILYETILVQKSREDEALLGCSAFLEALRRDYPNFAIKDNDF